jgi:hypothetical protein
MKLVLGRSFGLIGIVALAPAIGIVALTLRLFAGPGILREEEMLLGWRRVRTRRFATPRNGLGNFLRSAQLDHLPLLFDMAAGRISVLISYDSSGGVELAASAEPRQVGWLP